MLPEDARLAHDLLALRHRADALEDAANTHQAADFADVVLLVDGRCFRSVHLVVHLVASPMHIRLGSQLHPPCHHATSTNIQASVQGRGMWLLSWIACKV